MTHRGRFSASRRALALTLVPLVVAPVGAAHAREPRAVNTFEGTCELRGWWNSVAHPYTVAPAARDVTLDLAGTCRGTLDGRGVEGVPATWIEQFTDDLASCAASRGNGTARLEFQAPTKPTIRASVQRVNQLTHVLGAVGGDAAGAVTAYASPQPGHNLSDCIGTGYDRFYVRFVLSTVQPLTDWRRHV
jgi:hypothetical protein